MPLDADLLAQDYCYLTTTGRVTGRPHEIEIWFAHPGGDGMSIYLMSGGRDRSDWVRNLLQEPRAHVRLGTQHFEARARVLEDGEEADTTRRLLYEKYQPGYGNDLTSWRDRSLPVALDLQDGAST